MKNSDYVQNEYNNLCVQLGDKEYKLSILRGEVLELRAQIKNLNRIAPHLNNLDVLKDQISTSPCTDISVEVPGER